MGEGRADRQALAGLDEAAPKIRPVNRSQQKAFDLSAGRAHRAEAGGQHGGVVAKERVARMQELRQIGENVVRKAAV